MSSEGLRLLFFSDTHLGFAPRSRTGKDISDEQFSNFHRALEPSRVRPDLVFRAFELLKKIAETAKKRPVGG